MMIKSKNSQRGYVPRVKYKKRKNIKELFEDYQGKYEQIEINWGEAKGKEIW